MATVAGSGRASEFFDEVNSFKDNPQIHLHFLSSSKSSKPSDNGRVEICCHGCGTSLLVLFSEKKPGEGRRHMKVRDDFLNNHTLCKNRGYERECPNYRSKFEVIDIRRSTRKPKKPRQYLTKKDTNENLRSFEVRREGASQAGDGSTPQHGTSSDTRLDPRGPVRGG